MGHPSASGGKWIRPNKRLAIYLRDNLACVWCGTTVEDEEAMTLDHIVPHSAGGSNHESNLVTSCRRCNCSRRTRSVPSFAEAVANYHQKEDAGAIVQRVNRNRRRLLNRYKAEANAIIRERRSS